MSTRTQDDLRLLSLREAAKLVGVDRTYLARLVHSGEIKTVLVGTQARLPVWALREWQQRRAS